MSRGRARTASGRGQGHDRVHPAGHCGASTAEGADDLLAAGKIDLDVMPADALTSDVLALQAAGPAMEDGLLPELDGRDARRQAGGRAGEPP